MDLNGPSITPADMLGYAQQAAEAAVVILTIGLLINALARQRWIQLIVTIPAGGLMLLVVSQPQEVFGTVASWFTWTWGADVLWVIFALGAVCVALWVHERWGKV